MSHHPWIPAFLLAASALFAAQDKPAVPVPEFLDEVMYLDPSTRGLVKLEKSLSKMETKTKLGGFAGVKAGYSIEEPLSPVRIPSSAAAAFVIKMGEGDDLMGMLDPSQMISLYKLESGRSSREILMQSGGGMLSLGKSKSSAAITLNFRTVAEGVIEITTTKRLGKGEYAFLMMGLGGMMPDGSATLFAFGID